MFDEPVEAWKYGPVIDRLYQETKKHGNTIIEPDALKSFSGDISRYDGDLISWVIKNWGKKTGTQLSSATHQADTPWYSVWHHQGGQFQFGMQIPNEDIKKHYKEKLSL